ncbi:MAG: ABC transporter permease, partial [Micromonosporaceae bacterium]|nr:ABC transporter permease [Micromonosporaceae bacterium]
MTTLQPASPPTVRTRGRLALFNPTIARITARALFGQRRFLLLLPLPVVVVGLAVLTDWGGVDPREWVEEIVLALGLTVVLPVLALIIGTGVLGTEIDDGTLAHVLAKPLPRREIILSKLVVAVGVTTITTGIPLALTGFLAGSASLAVGLAVGAFVGSLAYCALFAALSLLTRRPVLIGLAYVLIWENLLQNILDGTRVLSIYQYVLTIVDRVADSTLVSSNLSLAVALSMAFIFT